MSFRTVTTGQDRLASLVAPSMAMTIAGAWVVCPVPAGALSLWAAVYQQAYDDAVRSVRAKYPGYAFPPSMNSRTRQ